MLKVATVSLQRSSEWVSCQSIAANLRQCYADLNEIESEAFFLEADSSMYAATRLAHSIQSWGASHLVFLDHAPCPALLLKAIAESHPNYRPQVVIHVYGDFVLQSPQWAQAEIALKQFQIQWVVASARQKRLLAQFFDVESIFVIGFPVSPLQFNRSMKVRQEIRQSQGVPDHAPVFFYSGRLSLQKNILQLLRAFDFYQKEVNTEARLWLSGAVDDLGLPYLGKRAPAGLMNYDLQTLLGHLFHGERRNCVQYLGQNDVAALSGFYNAADVLISLSTHNDEDFGMSPAEALLTGLPCVLTDWGGYSDFIRLFPDDCFAVPVSVGPSRVGVESSQVLRQLLQLPEDIGTAGREERARRAQKLLSSESKKAQLEQILKNFTAHSFSGFTVTFKKVVAAFSMNKEAPFSYGPEYSKLYRETYHVYWD